MVRQAPAVMVLPVRFARWITPIIQVCGAMVSLPAIHAWWNGKNTDALAQDGASSSPNVRLESHSTHLNPYTLKGRELHSDEETVFRFASECLRAEKVALRLVARAEQCSFGLTRKLKKRGYEAVCISAVITRLLELNFIDDARYAQLWMQSRLRLARSPRRLIVSLCGRGIDKDDAEAVLKTVLDEETEYTMLRRFLKKSSRKTAARNENSNGLRSLKHLLKNEGFSSQVIQKFIDEE